MDEPHSADPSGELLTALDWNKTGGLIPAVVQHARTLRVLMVAYMNREALEKTLESRQVTFFSRSKQRLWTKGETSGNVLDLVDLAADCDHDTVLVRALPRGPACHRGTTSCFDPGREAPDDAADAAGAAGTPGETAPGVGFLAELDDVIAGRQRDMPEGSYTTTLFRRGISRIAQKVGEEGVEVALAAKDPGPEGVESVENEAADLIYHLLVLLRARDTDLARVVEVLRQRHG